MATQEALRQNFRILFKSKWSTSKKKFKKSNEKDGIDTYMEAFQSIKWVCHKKIEKLNEKK